ncbi:MAG: hypothetical protein GXP27_20055, partial [Planctomycetes bacterium]|nr:hypothetical protein [Planctomycetota bacterium]
MSARRAAGMAIIRACTIAAVMLVLLGASSLPGAEQGRGTRPIGNRGIVEPPKPAESAPEPVTAPVSVTGAGKNEASVPSRPESNLSPTTTHTESLSGASRGPRHSAAPKAERPETVDSKFGKIDAVTFQRFLQWLKRQQTPAFDLLSVSLQGEVEGDRAVLTAAIRVQIHRENEWVLVPLRLTEAYLLEAPRHQYHGTGSGEARPDSPAVDRERGYRWWFRGRGVHSLEARLSVPVENGRLKLALPVPAAASSSLRLLVKGLAHVSVSVPEQTSVRLKSTQAGSQIELHGLGEMLDVSWQAVPKQRPGRTELQATTLILVQIGVESIVLEAYQTIRALRGNLNRVSVKVPDGFELLDVTGRDVQDYSVQPGGRIDVSLTSAVDETSLKWTLSAQRRSDQLELPVLTGFDVAGARRQSGYVALQTVEGFHVERAGEEGRFVHQVNVSDLRLFPELRAAVGTGQVVSAYRFLRQPFRLTLKLVRIEPYYTVEPHLFLKLAADRAELEAVFRCQVYRGAVRELILRWPMQSSDEWDISPSESAELVEEIIPGASPEVYLVRLVQPRSRADGPFEIRLRGRRAIPASEAEFSLTLPGLESSAQAPAKLIVALADNVDVQLRLASGAPLAPVADEAAEPAKYPEFVRELRQTVYRIDPANETLAIRVTAHEQQIQTETLVRVTVQRDRLAVQQRIRYEVAYERMAQARLLVPKPLRHAVAFAIQTESAGEPKRVSVSWGDSEVDQLSRVRVTLDQPRLGTFEILAEYVVELAGNRPAPTNVSLPLVTSADADFRSVQVEVQGDDGASATVAEPRWRRFATADRSSVWVIEEHRSQVPLVVQSESESAISGLAFPRAVVWTVFDPTGKSRTCVLLQCRGRARRLSVVLPPDVVVESFWWDRTEIADRFITREDGRQMTFHLDLAGLGGQEATG